MGHHQTSATVLCRQPQPIGARIDRHAFEHGVELEQHSAGPRLTHHRNRQAEPLGSACRANPQHRRMRFADQVTIAQAVAAQAFEIHLSTAQHASEGGAHTYAPRQPGIRHGRQLKTLGLGPPDGIAGIEAVQHIVLSVRYRPERITAPGQPGEITRSDPFDGMLADHCQFGRGGCRKRHCQRDQQRHPASTQSSTSARLPLDSSQLLRSPARFLASSMSMISRVPSKSSSVNCTSRRVLGSMVVSRS
jgi:hypothetical protein